MRFTPIPLLAVVLAGCSPGPRAPAEDRRASRIEAGMKTAETAQAQVEAAQRQDQAHIDSQLQAVSDTAPVAP